jgi:hypothetical protein
MSGVQPRTKAVFFPALPSVDALTGGLLSGCGREHAIPPFGAHSDFAMKVMMKIFLAKWIPVNSP